MTAGRVPAGLLLWAMGVRIDHECFNRWRGILDIRLEIVHP